MFGLKDKDIAYILKILNAFDEIEEALIFGSRAKGNYKAGSDIDLAICGDKVNFDTVSRLTSKLDDEGPLPYKVDIVDFTHLEHEDLKDHIDRCGKRIYKVQMD